MAAVKITKRRPYGIRHVIAAAERHFALPKGVLKSRDKRGRVCLARHLVCVILNREFGLSSHEIAKVLDKDHTSILHGIDKAREKLNSPLHLTDYDMIVGRAERIARDEGYDLLADDLEPTPAEQRIEKPTSAVRPVSTPVLCLPDPPRPITRVISTPGRAREMAASLNEDIYPPRRWWNENNDRFVAAMRLVHPDREVLLVSRPR